MKQSFGAALRDAVDMQSNIPFMGVQDVFGASIAANHFNGIFISGFSFAASYYGLPDIGFIAWPDIAAFAQRVRTILPSHHIVVDIDDGYCDSEVAGHVVSLLENSGASAVILEDQQRPRKCGHYSGKQLLPLEQFTEKLDKVLQTRRDMFVIARTDAAEENKIIKRVQAFADCGADSILVDGVKDLGLIAKLRDKTGLPVTLSQMSGGKTPLYTLKKLQEFGVSLTMYSTPCLFAAQDGMEKAMQTLKENGGLLPTGENGGANMEKCTSLLHDNLTRRDQGEA